MPKVLLAGSIQLDLEYIFNRVKGLNASKGPFDLLLCVGNFANDDDGMVGNMLLA